MKTVVYSTLPQLVCYLQLRCSSHRLGAGIFFVNDPCQANSCSGANINLIKDLN